MEERFYKDAVDNLFLGVCRVDSESKIIYWNKGAEDLTGMLREKVIGKRLRLSKENCPIEATLIDGEMREKQITMKVKNGKKLHMHLRITPTISENKVIGAVVMFHDISSNVVLLNRVNELQKTASFDYLTGLPNRRLFEKILAAKIEEMGRDDRKFGIIFIDVDNFKKINDEMGHDVGDLALRSVAKKLYDSLRPYDMLCRWGGDEFVAMINNVNREQLHAAASRLRSMIDRLSIFDKDKVVKVSVSIGAVLANEKDTIQSLIKRADSLMYASKNSGKNKVTIEVKN
ncbi:MAG: sensor domain-containing diguanylate cyclase [Candidatus Pacearchaeota archaeon]